MMPSSLKPLLIASLEAGMNRYLALDEHLEEYLAPMAGKVIELHIDSLDASLYLCPGTSGIQILESYPAPADARLSGSLSALGLMSLSSTPMHSLFKGQVKMDGDTQLARRLQRLFDKLDINLEAKLARYTSAEFAGRLGKLLRSGRDWTRNSLDTFRRNLEEFLQEETRELPAKQEAELLFRDIDDLRNAAERLEARLQRLASASTEQP